MFYYFLEAVLIVLAIWVINEYRYVKVTDEFTKKWNSIVSSKDVIVTYNNKFSEFEPPYFSDKRMLYGIGRPQIPELVNDKSTMAFSHNHCELILVDDSRCKLSWDFLDITYTKTC
jgi:5,10-methylene-tetrahydrofolate dehydrogenase/methenyl tetrahydrofolate cyclohydrolase